MAGTIEIMETRIKLPETVLLKDIIDARCKQSDLITSDLSFAAFAQQTNALIRIVDGIPTLALPELVRRTLNTDELPSFVSASSPSALQFTANNIVLMDMQDLRLPDYD